MSHIIVSLGTDNQNRVRKIISHFENIYIISEGIESFDTKGLRPEQKISLLLMPNMDSLSLAKALYNELTLQLSKDKITDLDIAVNIISGSGATHSALLSAVIKLGYGIRIVDVNSKGELIEL